MENIISQKCAFIILQSDWNDVLREVNSKVWVSVKHCGCEHSSSYGEIKTTDIGGDGLPVLETSDGFEVECIKKRSLIVRNIVFDILAKFNAPVMEFYNIHKKSITSLHISEGGGLGVTASTDEMLHIWDTKSGSVRRSLEGHIGDVNCCKFFPSGLVVLSGGMDTQLKIWSAEDGLCARTLNGAHKAGVLCMDIVERGRNVLSCGRDGSVQLWDCGSAECIATVATERSEINGCALGLLHDDDTDVGQQEGTNEPKSKLEVGAEGKLLAIACENGNLEGYNLARRTLLFSLSYTDSLNCCCFIDDTTLVAGSQDGSILVMNTLNPSYFLLRFKSCASPILSVYPSSSCKQAFWVSSGNGRCCLLRFIEENQSSSSRGDISAHCRCHLALEKELTGSDCDPVYQVVESSDGHVYTSCRDSVVRKYKIWD